MHEPGLQYRIERNLSIERLKTRLLKELDLEEEPAVNTRRVYLDSFDWRLFAAGTVLIHEAGDAENRLSWESLGGGEELASLRPVDTVPEFVWDFPACPLKARIKPLLEMRSLLPLAEVRVRSHRLRLLDKNKKTVLRLALEQIRANGPGGGRGPILDARIRLSPIKGYNKPKQKAIELIESLGLRPADNDIMVSALARVGRQPLDYSSKLDISLDPAMRGDEAARAILLNLLDTLQRNAEGTRRDLDSEFLHDFRVAVRRTRSALTQIKDVLPQRVIDRFAPEFGWLGQITGPTRDLDVYLLNFDTYRDSLPYAIREDLEPLRTFLQNHQKHEQQSLAGDLDSARYRRLVAGWRKLLETPVPARSTLPNARRPIKDLADERIWKLYRRVIKEGRAITDQSPAESLHELRKTCKKLRYLMEFFQSLYPGKEIKALIKVLKAFQENLGDFQDYEVQSQSLKHFSEQMMRESKVPAGTLMAMGILVDDLQQRQHRAREEFSARFATFAQPENRTHFAELFSPEAKP